MLTQENTNEKTNHKGLFSVNVILTESKEYLEDPIIEIYGKDIKPSERKVLSVNETHYKEKLKALTKIKKLKEDMKDLLRKVDRQEEELVKNKDHDYFNRTYDKITEAKFKRKKQYCSCNNSCIVC